MQASIIAIIFTGYIFGLIIFTCMREEDAWLWPLIFIKALLILSYLLFAAGVKSLRRVLFTGWNI